MKSETKKGAHGEPWLTDTLTDGYDWVRAITGEDGVAFKRVTEHAIACVNALDGLNPDGVAVAVEALRDFCNMPSLLRLMDMSPYQLAASLRMVHEKAEDVLEALGVEV